MKKILCSLLAVTMCSAMVLSFTGCGSSSKKEPGYKIEATEPDLTNEGFGYYIVNSNELMITEYTGSSKDVVIPESYNNYAVTTIGPNAFSDLDIESVTMPDTVTEIQSYAFQSCTKLKNVKLSNNLKTFGNNVFFLCTALESVEIPVSVEDLGTYTFQGSAVKSITIPEGKLTEIRDYVFYQCPALTEVVLPSCVTKMQDNTISENKNAVTVKAPAGSYAESYVKKNGAANNLKFEVVK